MKEVVEQVVGNDPAVVGERMTITGSLGSLLGWLTSSEFGVLAGLAIGIAGLALNWHYKRKEDKRAEEAHRLLVESHREIYERNL